MPEIEAQTAYWFGMVARGAWIIFAAYYSWYAFWELRIDSVAYKDRPDPEDGKKIVRRRRHQRSRGMFWGFFLALGAGALGWISFLLYTPRVETSVANIGISVLVLGMLFAFSRGKEADLAMRKDAFEHRKLHPPKSSVDRDVGQEIAEGPGAPPRGEGQESG